MFRSILRLAAACSLAAPLACACSVPQYQPPYAPDASTADQLIAAGHYRRALTLITKAGPPPANPADAARHDYLLSRVLLALRELDAALQSAEKALAAEPKVDTYHVQAAAVAGRMAEHGNLFKQLGYAKRAKKELEEALSINPRSADGIYGMVLYAWNAPSFIGGDKARAQQLAEQLTAIDPPRGYLLQASLAKDRKDAAAEEALLKKALAADPKSYEAHIAMATFAAGAQPARRDEADEHACDALYLEPSRSEAWQMLTEMAAADECWLEVDGLLGVAAQFNPDDLSPEYKAALAMVGMGKNLARAEVLLRDYLSHPQEGETPSPGRARYEVGVVLEKQGRKDEALAMMQMALSEDPTLEDARKDIKRLSSPN